MKLIDRFNGKWLMSNGCWMWIDAIRPDGYGEIHVDRRTVLAHRVSYELHNGEIKDGMCVCHSCDNPACVNPAHLFIGTHNDNMQDMIKKGRNNQAKGESAGHAKLTEANVIQIRACKHELGTTNKELARLYDVSEECIRQIHRRETWTHI